MTFEAKEMYPMQVVRSKAFRPVLKGRVVRAACAKLGIRLGLRMGVTLGAMALGLFLCVAGVGAGAQSATAGAIGGTVTDANGALLPAAQVTVSSAATGFTRTVKANASGEYRVIDLEPATYTVTFKVDGFETYAENSVVVTVGSLATVSPKLKVGSVANTVEVTDQAPDLHTQDNAVSTVIDQNAIDNLPINGRRYSDFARLTPGVVSNTQGFGLLSFRGISFLLNNATVDGADDNQAYYSEARGRTRTAFTIPPSAVQEFQVNTSNYSAQYGRAAGGVINTVTKSGSNTLHGELFFYDRDNSLGGAVNPYTLLSIPNANGTYTSVPTKPKDWRKDWGFTLTGPLIHDKLFFAYTYDQERRNFPAISRPTDPNDLLAPSNATLPSNETCSTTGFTTTALTYSAEGDYNSCEIAALFGVSFQAGSAYYQQGLGIVASFLGYVPRRQDQVINLPKLDWQINDRNRLTLLYNRMRYSSPHGLYSQASTNEGRSGFGNDNVKEDFGILRLSSVLTNSIVNEALVQYGRDFEFDYQDKPLPNEVPLAQNSYGAAAGTQIGYFLSSGFYAGSNPNLTRYADPDERRLQLLDGLTWSYGKHTAKFGLEYNKVSDYDNNLYNGNGGYSYDWSYTFIADYLNATTGLGGPVVTIPPSPSKVPPPSCAGGGSCYNQQYYTFSQAFGNPAALIATREYAGYATDDWRVTPNLTLTLGVRYEYEYVPSNPFVNTGNPGLALVLPNVSTALPQTSQRPDDRNNIGPRVGFAWNVYGDGKTTLRGGYGMYYGRIINSNIIQTYVDSGSPNGQISFTNLHPAAYTSSTNGATAGCGPTFPNLEVSEAAIYDCYSRFGGFNSSTVAYFDKHFQNPQVHEADLAVEQDLGHGTTFGITYMMSLGRELPTALDTNLALGATVTAPYAVTPLSTSPLSSYCINPNSECATSLAKYPLATITTGGYITLPNGGKTPPAYPQGYQGKFFVGGAKGTNAYYRVLDVKSAVNSSYNALAFQLNKRYDHGLSLLTNFTWAHGLDENPYQSTVVPTETAIDPTNLRSEYGNSVNDVRLRYVGALVYQPQTNFHNEVLKQTLGGWRIAPLVQLQTGLPYSATIATSSFYNVGSAALTGSGVNGSGSDGANRVPWQHRNSFNYPKTAVFDMRLGKNFYLPTIGKFDRVRLEFFAEVFNVMNHQNITGITTEAYTLTDATVNGAANTPTLTPYPLFGTYTNANSNYTYSPRQMQLAMRIHF